MGVLCVIEPSTKHIIENSSTYRLELLCDGLGELPDTQSNQLNKLT